MHGGAGQLGHGRLVSLIFAESCFAPQGYG
jgi:hypothetical protein